MTTTVTVTMRGDEWIAKAIPAMNKAVTEMAKEGALQAQDILKMGGGVRSAPWNPPHSQHGNAGLRGRINYTSPETAGTPLRAGFGTDLAYGRHLEFGAVIKPKTAKRIIIPLNRAAQRLMAGSGAGAAGAGRRAIESMGYRNVRHNAGSKRERQVAFLPTRKGETLVCVTSNGKVVRSEPMFLLAREAVIKPRPWLLRSAIQGKEAIQARGRAVAGAELKKAGLVA